MDNLVDIIKPEHQVFCKTKLMTDAALSYCPGCGHGTAHNLTMEVIDEMGIVEDTIGVPHVFAIVTWTARHPDTQ